MAVEDTKPPSDTKAGKDKDAGKGAKGKKEAEPELSEEELQLKQNLDLLVERVGDSDAGIQKAALAAMCNEIRSATATMTSVPKPLKFLREHYDVLKARFEALPLGENRSALADILSILATTKEVARETLKFRLAGTTGDIKVWGHEYMRHLAGEIAAEYKLRAADSDDKPPVDDLMQLVQQIVPYHMSHNAEPEAVDLLLEVERLDLLQVRHGVAWGAGKLAVAPLVVGAANVQPHVCDGSSSAACGCQSHPALAVTPLLLRTLKAQTKTCACTARAGQG